ncbi:phytanoyl-CoA dioxygenase [Nitzschia inconspicua]|uniref:Phytanoyl-CoA dioxygenase n=1 Tax=Nitzschia inconspicua TaxID=303405 RepID=A0A9K3LGI5_9STRA|nr:phytanoyl-CoA dioxygenase [Nitzschia inconspicua]
MSKSSIKGPVLDLPHVEGATATADEVATYLDTHGVVVIDNLMDVTSMDQLSKDLRATSGCFYGAEGSFAGAHTVRNAGKPLGESKVAQELALHPLIRASIQKRLGRWCKRVVLGTCSAITVEAPPSPDIEPAPPQVLHRDESMWGCTDWPWLPQTTSDRPELAITVMWAVSDFTVSNGATRIIPGSHRWPRSGDESQEEDDDLAERDPTQQQHQQQQQEQQQGNTDHAEPGATHAPMNEEEELENVCVPAVMSKGSVMLWSGATIHGQGAHAPLSSTSDNDETIISSFSSQRREGLLFIYNVGWLRPEHNFHWAMPPHVWDSLPPKLQVLMGKIGTNRTDHEWYSGPVYAQPILGTAVATNAYPEDSTDDNNNHNHDEDDEDEDFSDVFVAQAT